MILEIAIVLIVLVLMVLFFFASMYVAVIGSIGLQFFRYNFPLLKKRGAHYFILQKDGRFKWIYKKFQSVWKWKDGSVTHISKKFDRLAQSAEPLIFLIEGFPTNVRLFNQLPKAEISKFVNNIIKESYSTGKLVEENEDGKGNLSKLLPIIGIVVALITAIISLAIFLNLGDISQVLNEIKPYVPQAIEALKAGTPRTI